MPGDIVAISHNITCHAMTARVIAVDTDCWEGMAFLQIYELGQDGAAVERRMAYVAVDTVTLLTRRPAPAVPRRPNELPRVPRPRPPADTTTPIPGRTR